VLAAESERANAVPHMIINLPSELFLVVVNYHSPQLSSELIKNLALSGLD
jgi:hypothetical protein